MKITLDIPDTTIGAFFCYTTYGLSAMGAGVHAIYTNALKDDALIKVQPEGENGNEID